MMAQPMSLTTPYTTAQMIGIQNHTGTPPAVSTMSTADTSRSSRKAIAATNPIRTG